MNAGSWFSPTPEKSKVAKFSCDEGSTTFCCGVLQIGSFSEYSNEYSKDTPQELIAAVNSANKGYFIQAWFVRLLDFEDKLNEEYQNAELRDYVKNMPNVKHLGTTINPNSDNEIDGYMWLAE